MNAAEAVVAGTVVALCLAIVAARSTTSPRVSALLSTLAVPAALAMVLRRVLGGGAQP